MLEALGEALRILFQPLTMGVILGGMMVSLIFGLIPGLSGMVAMALFLPLVFGLPEDLALPLLISLVSVSFTGGSITAVLINIPGTSCNAPTTIDGFPLTQKGEGARAVGAAITASMVGGALFIPVAILMIIPIVPVVLSFKTPELFMLIVAGLAFVGVLSVGSMAKGLISGGIGLLLSFIGFEAMTGEARFTFGSTFLYQGLGLIPVMLGLFAVVELADMVSKKRTAITISPVVGGFRDTIRGAKDVLHHKWLTLLSGTLGYIVGIIPGIGGDVAAWLGYGQAKQISKNREKFGSGEIEGIIAPEAANNAVVGGGLLTTLAFGIPGSAPMAIFLGGLLLLGITPGPSMLTEHLPLSLALLIGIGLCNIVAGFICLAATRYLVKVAYIPLDFLFAGVIAISFVAAFTVSDNPLGIAVVIGSGLLGFFMKRFGYSRPACVLGFILGTLFEKYFFHALQLHGPFFFVTPISLTILGFIVLILLFPYLRRVYVNRTGGATRL